MGMATAIAPAMIRHREIVSATHRENVSGLPDTRQCGGRHLSTAGVRQPASAGSRLSGRSRQRFG